jgi:hypothetical protein
MPSGEADGDGRARLLCSLGRIAPAPGRHERLASLAYA